jgi:large subunit ribosomal protein L23
MIKPVFTEKSTRLAKMGKYTFSVERGMTKPQIKALVNELFDVHVVGIKTVKVGGETGRNARGKSINRAPGKKAIVELKGDEKIDLFEEKKKK